MIQELPSSDANKGNNKNISVRALRQESRNTISTLLNPEKVLKTPEGLPRYWLGLAELCDINLQEIANIRSNKDQSAAVLDLWIQKNPSDSTITNLEKYLEQLDRFDIIDDIQVLIDEDIEFFKKYPDGYKVNLPIIDDKDILFAVDVERKQKGLPPLIYDGFVLYADEDVDFAWELIQNMQNKPYNLELCTREDLPGGCIELDTIIQCISNRCKRLVVIFSPDFFKSSANEFYCRYAQMEGIEQRKRKVIPCLYRPCDNLPPDLRMYFLLDYERSKKLKLCYWDLLFKSVATASQKAVVPSHTKLTLKTSMETLKPESKPINHVKFNSMVNLNLENDTPTKEVVSPSSSYNSLEPYVGGLKKKNSIYKTIKGLINPRRTRHSDGNIEKPLSIENLEKEVPGSDKEGDKLEVDGFIEHGKIEKDVKENGAVKTEKSKKKEKPPKLRDGIMKIKIWKSHKVKVPVNC